MKEIVLRKWHRQIGIGVVLFLIIQGGTGLVISIGDLRAYRSGSGVLQQSEGGEKGLLFDLMELVHRGGGTVGAVYRILIGAAFLMMAISGTMIYLKIRARMPKK